MASYLELKKVGAERKIMAGRFFSRSDMMALGPIMVSSNQISSNCRN
jgi:hypothetical protein